LTYKVFAFILIKDYIIFEYFSNENINKFGWKPSGCINMIQLELDLTSPNPMKKAHLFAPESPKQAFYRIWLNHASGKFKVLKESGARAVVLDRRSWEFEDLEAAEKFYNRQIKHKTNPLRKSPRKYKLLGTY
jgi:hypothetical protein